MNSLTSEPNRRTSTSDRRSSELERTREGRRISNPAFNNPQQKKRLSSQWLISDLIPKKCVTIFSASKTANSKLSFEFDFAIFQKLNGQKISKFRFLG